MKEQKSQISSGDKTDATTGPVVLTAWRTKTARRERWLIFSRWETFRCFVDHCDRLMGIDVFLDIEYHEMWCLSSIVFATEIFDCMFNDIDTCWSLKLFQRCQSGFCRRRPRRTRTGWGKNHIMCLRFTTEEQKYTNKTCRCSLASDHFNWGFRDCS